MSPKVLHVSEADQWTGGTAQLLALAEALRGKGWEVEVACRPGSGLSRHCAERGLPAFLVALREDYDVLSAWRLAARVKGEGIDVVHAHHNRSHAVCLLAKLILRLQGHAGPALVVSRRVSFPPGKNPFSRWKYRSALIDRIAAVADAVKDVLVAAGVPESRVSVIRSGTDAARFSPRDPDPAAAKSLGLPAGRLVVGKIANASPWKGQTVLLAAAQILLRRGRPAHFVFAGRDTAAPWMQEEVRRLGIGEHVTLAGFRTDVPEILSCLAVSVNAATRGEGLSGALRESLAMGVPVVASDIAGNRELLAGLEGDWLFAPGDAEALAERLDAVLSRLPEAKARVAAWRKARLGAFTLEATVAETDALYRELIANRGR